ncbi:MAG: hypothetical protein QW818_00100 [Candidatus Aenigmatarchaeota archaeon]|nr:hypothetical protein [Candidatus Aenigmarchaeota archaeon]
MNRFLIFTFILSFLLSISTVFAAGVELSVKSNIIGYTTEVSTVDVTVRNTQNKTDTFTLSLFPTQFEKILASLESFILTLSPNEEKIIKLTFSIPIDAEPISTQFELTARSTSDASIFDTKNVILTVQRLTSVYIPSVTLEKYTLNPGEEVRINVKVFNLEDTLSEKNFLKITVRKGRSIVKSFDESLDSIGAKSSIDVIKSFNLDKYAAPGSYVVEVELRDVSGQLRHSKSDNFQVNAVTQPPTEYTKKDSSYTILFSSVSIKVKNEGNIELPSFKVTESIPKFAQALFDPDVEPISTDSSVNRVVYTWLVPTLAPGEQYTITYKFAIWRIWLTFALLGGVGYGAYRWLSKPRISKTVRHEGEITRGKEILVLLEVKNKALHEIKDVEIVDVVPQIAKVVDRFDTLRPKIKRVPDGTELRWKIGSMRSGEERIITYRIKPVVDVVGHLTLPEAQMVFLDRQKVKRMSVSKEALVKAGV